MMVSYFLSFCSAHKMKIMLLVMSVALYFGLAGIMLNVGESLPEITSLPFKSIGVETIVQKNGDIPEKMTGAIFPHSNGPLYDKEVTALASLSFTEDYDTGLFIWYFDSSFFKSLLGVNPTGHVLSGLLQKNLEAGDFVLDSHHILVTRNLAQGHNLSIGGIITFGERRFIIAGILKPSPSGNIIPADVYMTLDSAQDIAMSSPEMQTLYKFTNKSFVNVVAIKSDPRFKGDKENAIKALNKDYLIFSEKTFSKDVENQIAIISSFGKIMFLVLGLIVIILFGLLTFYNFKTREPDVAVLRIIGWPMIKLKSHFIMESLILLVAGLLLGNLLAIAGLFLISRQSVTMELPWELSAKPHFLPQENAITRTITAFIPIHLDWVVFLMLAVCFLLVFGIIIFLLFNRIKQVKPLKYSV